MGLPSSASAKQRLSSHHVKNISHFPNFYKCARVHQTLKGSIQTKYEFTSNPLPLSRHIVLTSNLNYWKYLVTINALPSLILINLLRC